MWMYQGVSDAKARLIRYIRSKAEESDKGTGVNIDSGIPLNYEKISTVVAIETSKIKDFLNELEKENIVVVKETIIVGSLERIKEYEYIVMALEEFREIEECEEIIGLREESEG